jgi:hypothetical protein
MGKRICLVGFSDINREWATDQPDTMQLWGINEAHNCTEKLKATNELGRTSIVKCACYDPNACRCGDSHTHMFLPRYDRMFQLHPPDWKDAKQILKFNEMNKRIDPRDLNCFGRNAKHRQFLRECQKPVYMLFPQEDMPSAVKYPVEAIAESVGRPWGDGKQLYSTSTISYMLALALHEHLQGDTLDEIRLAGIELSVGTEYFWQKPATEFYLGMAIGLGITVTLPPTGSSVLGAPSYILDTDAPIPSDYKHEAIPIYQPTRKKAESLDLAEVAVAD